MGQLATVAEYQIVRLPEDVTYRQGALIEPTAVAAYGVERAGVGPGDKVLVTGAGPIGALAALCARAAGASTVYVSEPNPARRARAEALEVATVLDPSAVDVPELLREQSDGLGVDVAIECSGHPNGFATGIRSLRRRGTLAQTGLFVGAATVEPMLWALNDLTIVGTWCYWVYDFDRDRGADRRRRPAGRARRHAQCRPRRCARRFRLPRIGHGGRDQGADRPVRRNVDEGTGLRATAERSGSRRRRCRTIGADEVLVRSRNVGICHSDFELYAGKLHHPRLVSDRPGPRVVGRDRGGRGAT